MDAPQHLKGTIPLTVMETPFPNQRPNKLTVPVMQEISHVRECESLMPLSRVEEPPWSEPHDFLDPPWSSPSFNIQEAPEPEPTEQRLPKSKVRCDKNVKRGSFCDNKEPPTYRKMDAPQTLYNLPDHLKGNKIPLTVRLDMGMCVELQYNGGLYRRGIVYADPAVSLMYMWWQPTTRFRSGQIPICTKFEHNIPKERMDGFTIEPVEDLETWLSGHVPLTIKRSFGWTYKRPSRAKPRSVPKPPRSDKGKKHAPPSKFRSDRGVKKKVIPAIPS